MLDFLDKLMQEVHIPVVTWGRIDGVTIKTHYVSRTLVILLKKMHLSTMEHNLLSN